MLDLGAERPSIIGVQNARLASLSLAVRALLLSLLCFLLLLHVFNIPYARQVEARRTGEADLLIFGMYDFTSYKEE